MARSISAGGDSGPGRGPLDQRMQNNVRIGVSPHGNGDEDSDAYFTDDEEVRRLSELDDGRLLVSNLRGMIRQVCYCHEQLLLLASCISRKFAERVYN
jgi:hypothetical protein